MPFNSITAAIAAKIKTRKITKTFHERLWSKIQIGNPENCWEWSGARQERGHGVIKITGEKKNMLVHRAVFEEIHGPIPDGVLICHTCDNPPCCNPNHLFSGTQVDNMSDCSEKERIFKMKLTYDEVKKMKQMRMAGMNWSAIGRAFNVHRSTAKCAVTGKTWKHIH